MLLSRTQVGRTSTLIIFSVFLLLLSCAATLHAQDLTLKNYKIEFLGRSYVAASDETTFTYTATGTGTGMALSHITFSLILCDYLNRVVSYSPNIAVSLGLDPTTGVEGIKWDIGVGVNQSQLYSVTLSGNVLASDISVAVKAGPSYETGTLPGPDCAPRSVCTTPTIIDFEGLPAGTKVGTQFQSSHGVSIAAINGNPAHPDEALIFDTANPTGEDEDLGTPNQAFGGPGIGVGPNAGTGNDTALFNTLIIAEDDVDIDGDSLVDDPDDEASGGQLLFSFDGNVELSEMQILDVEEAGGSITGFDGGGTPVFTVPIPAPGDNTAQDIDLTGVDSTGTRLLAVDFVSSGSVGELKVCVSPSASPSPSASASPSPSPSVSPSGSPSVSPSSSPSVSPSSSPSMTPSASPSSSPSKSPSPSPSKSPKPSSSPSPSISPKPSKSPSPSMSPKPSRSPSPSPSMSSSPTPSPSPSSSPSISPSVSPSTTPSASPSVSASASPSQSPSASPSSSPSSSPNPSVSASPSMSPIPSMTPGASPSASPSVPPSCIGTVDDCGICNGPGKSPCGICPGQPGYGDLSCLGCTDVNITDSQTTMDQGVKLQEDIARQVTKRLLRAFPDDKKIKKYVANVREIAFFKQDTAWKLSWSVPSVTSQCENPPEFCITSSENAAVTAEYSQLTRDLHKLIKKAIRRFRRLTGNPNGLRKLLKKAKRELKNNLATAETLPPVTTSCI